ncbi:hypothetical protein HY357_04925 [Candidatus Roizmanbacteria bacterium]|nr:hypothetical protein [Candidatus Roizmanbacteria bacterium]
MGIFGINDEERDGVDYKETRRTPHYLRNYEESIKLYPKMFSELKEALDLTSDQIRRIFDGGCGYAASTLAIGRTFPEAMR